MPTDPLPPDADRWARVADVFDAVADLPPEARADSLDRLCRATDGTRDDDLLGEVAALLDADRAVQSSPEPLDLQTAAALVEAGPASGERIGPWRVLRAIGRGGMGRVDLVERADGGYEQRAALKRLSLVAPSRLRRFLRERQILASLQHPAIAQLLDGGVASGAPYLVMEYVDGAPITHGADDLPLRQRLELLVQVCDAVAYAHRHLVVHRDLKPSNVLVATHDDGSRHVKLLDFGIAKLLDPETEDELTALYLRTPMTQAYAAPEQVCGAAITTATDVYGLGLLAFELLTGRRPFAADGTVRALETDILETAAPLPSAVSDPASGGVDPRALRGDLDVICQTALAKDPEARYASAEAIAADFRRSLRGEPITARAPSLSYRVRRFVNRHRTPVWIGALALVAMLSVAAVAWLRVDREQAVAQRAVAEADAVAETQGELLRILQPSTRAQRDSLRDAPPLDLETIDQAIETVEATQAETPRVLAGNLLELGTALYERRELVRADELFTRALALRRPLSRDADPVIRSALLGRGHIAYERSDRDAAQAFYREALEMERQHPELTAGVGANSTEMHLAGVLGDTDENERVILKTLAMRRAAAADNATAETEIAVAQAHNQLAGHYFNEVDYRAAFGEFLAAERIVRRHLGELHPSTNTLRGNLSFTAAAMGRYDEAEQQARIALDAARRGGLGSFVEARMLQAIGQALYYQHDLAGAERDLRAADALLRPLGEDGAGVRHQVRSSLVATLQVQGRLEEALAIAETLLAQHQQDGTLDAPHGIHQQAHVTALRFALGDRDGTTEQLLARVRDIRRSDATPDLQASVIQIAGEALRESGDAQAAEPLLREALATLRRAHPDGHLNVRRAQFDYGRALAALGRLDEARPHLKAARGYVLRIGYPSVLQDVDAEIDRLLAGH